MYCVFLGMLYERQLRKLDNSSVDEFIQIVKQEAEDNGADFNVYQNVMCFSFKDSCIACAYSVSRFLFYLNNILAQKKTITSDIICFADYFKDAKLIDELVLQYKKILLPSDAIFVSKNLSNHLNAYIDFVVSDVNSTILKCSVFKFFINNDIKNVDIKKKAVIVHRNDNYFWAIYNFMLSNPIADKYIETLSEADKKSYLSTKNVFLYLQKHRFADSFPQYFIDAFSVHAGIYLNLFIHYYNHDDPVNILIDNINDKKTFNEAEKILAVNKSALIYSMNCDIPVIYNLPFDLLELIYIMLYASRYFFYNELPDFLLSLNKGNNFFNDVYNWMYSIGILAIYDNIYSIPYGLFEIIERRLGAKKKHLNISIAEFLWDKYKKGFLYADKDSEKIFSQLNFHYKNDFLISLIYHQYSDDIIETIDLKKIKEPVLINPIKQYIEAALTRKNYKIGNEYSLIKNSLSFFQEHNFFAGEYRSLSLLAFFNLSENKLSDALTYFSYALDNAEQYHDIEFLCEALFNISVVYFLQNNFLQSMKFLERLLNIINVQFEPEWKIPCLFMQGRIFLQLGEFKNAEETFNLAADFASLYFEELEPICRTWSGRAIAYSGKFKYALNVFYKNIEYTDDALLFLLETLLISGAPYSEFEKIDMDISNIYSSLPVNTISKTKNVKSGFNFAEDLLWYKKYGMPIGKKLFKTFYNYMFYKNNFFKSASADLNLQSYIADIEDIAITALYQNDSLSSFYLYLCYKLSIITHGESDAQTLAYLSKAFKALQKNVLVIGENDIRNKYMQNNFWNGKLFDVAKKHKLI